MSKDRREEYDEQAYSQDQAYDQDEAYDEEEYDSEDELQEDEDQQEEEDSAYEEEYDEDVFSLEEDLRREHRKQWTQYLVFAICAAVVVGLAIYGSIQLTHRRLESQQGIQVQPMPGAASPDDTPPFDAMDTDSKMACVASYPCAMPTSAPTA